MLNSLFNPDGVAIIGASSRKFHIGNRIVKNLLNFGYSKGIYPINPKAERIYGLVAYKSILDIKGNIDIAHIVIPAKFVSNAVEDCGKKGVKNIIINSGGFSETGEIGKSFEKEFMRIASKFNIRILGPNCQGIINSDKNVRAYCNFTFTFPKPGNISIVTTSGGVAELIHQSFVFEGVGTRIYASSGNECDISLYEIIEYLGNDNLTHVIVLYLEGLKNPLKFVKTVKGIVKNKPILAMKAGNTIEGAKAAASHTGSLIENDISTNLVFDKAGILNFQDEKRMINSATILSSQPLLKGKSVVVLTNTGGPAVIATDVLIKSGFLLSNLSNNTINFLKNKLNPGSSLSNPIDVLATGTSEHFKYCLETLIFDKNVDAIFINFVTPFFVDSKSIALEIAKINKKNLKPIVCNLITDFYKWDETVSILKNAGVPCFRNPTEAAYALSSLNDYRNILNKKSGKIKKYKDIDYESVRDIFYLAKKNKQNYLLADQTYKILESYKIDVPKWRVCDNIENLLKSAKEIGYPLVLKVNTTDIVHKTDVGGVLLNLKNDNELKDAYNSILFKLKKNNLSFLIQSYLPSDIEIILGAKSNSSLGHIVMFGFGGTLVEIFKDITFSLTPLTDLEAINMIKSVKAYKLLSGFRNKEASNIFLISELIQRLSQLVTDFKEIEELDFNPIVPINNRIVVLDVRICLKK